MNAVPQNRKLPPMLQQYLQYKKDYPDCLLLFQVGDFYESFFQDAVTISGTLNITLTSRDKNSEDPIPMAGVPIAVVDGYMERLVNAGFSVALVSQAEPATGKGMVARKLDRIVTPGVRLLGTTESSSSETIVAAIGLGQEHRQSREPTRLSIAYSDIQTGEILIREGCTLGSLTAELRRISPREVILPREVEGRQIDRRLGWVREIDCLLGGSSIKFRHASSLSGRARDLNSIEGYSALDPTAKKASHLLIEYVDEITVDTVMPISTIRVKTYENVLTLDATTRTNLELVSNLKEGGKEGTLFQIMDFTRTIAGERLLRQWILNPLKNLKEIQNRTLAVRALVRSRSEREQIQEALRYMTDFERIAARLELGIVSPRELGAVRNAADVFPEVKKQLEQILSAENDQGERLALLRDGIKVPEKLLELLSSALVDNPPPGINDGGMIRDGFNEELDRLRDIKSTGKTWIVELEAKERELTGIPSLKIKFNNVHGYFLEVTKANLDKVPERFTRKQTMTNAERFITAELKRLEEEVLGAGDKQKILERELFVELKNNVVPYASAIRAVGRDIAELDVLLSLAELADKESLVEAVITDSSRLIIESGRHPVVAKLLKGSFIPNSTFFKGDESNCYIITGANMGGKSTYLRQVGLIVIMAQMGSFVPAKKAEIGLVDKVFARIGASDDLLEGESTFMVEMREASNIVSNATDRSLLLIDEIGRGTATSDGLAIAQAILEWIVLRIKSRTLFATHFHELTVLEEKYSAIANYSVGSVDEGDSVIFTHEIVKGAANKSYGLEVAVLAGLPNALVHRARELLTELDVDDVVRAASCGSSRDSQLSMFSEGARRDLREREVESDKLWERIEVSHPSDYQRLKELGDCIEDLDLNSVTPLEALNLLNSLKSSLGEDEQK